jgi:hypothetical protein
MSDVERELGVDRGRLVSTSSLLEGNKLAQLYQPAASAWAHDSL